MSNPDCRQCGRTMHETASGIKCGYSLCNALSESRARESALEKEVENYQLLVTGWRGQIADLQSERDTARERAHYFEDSLRTAEERIAAKDAEIARLKADLKTVEGIADGEIAEANLQRERAESATAEAFMKAQQYCRQLRHASVIPQAIACYSLLEADFERWAKAALSPQPPADAKEKPWLPCPDCSSSTDPEPQCGTCDGRGVIPGQPPEPKPSEPSRG